MKAYICDACNEMQRGHPPIKTIERDARSGRMIEADICSTECAGRRFMARIHPTKRADVVAAATADAANRPSPHRLAPTMHSGAGWNGSTSDTPNRKE